MRAEIVHRKELGPTAWNRAVDAAPAGWWWHRAEWVDYSLAYAPGSVDRSFVVAVNGNVTAVMPLVVLDRRTQVGGQPFGAGPAFLFESGAPLEVVLATSRETQRHVLDDSRVMLRPFKSHDLSRVPPAPPGLRRCDRRTFVVDLRLPAETRLARLRKSYRQAVKKAADRYSFAALTGDGGVHLSRLVHAQAAGRVTRSVETWDMMDEWVGAGHAVNLLAVEGREHVAFAYAIRYKRWAYYASGASLRDDVGHAVQWHVMQALAADGETQHYELGHDADEDADDKERGIALFKAGFGGDTWTVPAIEPAAAKTGGLTRD